MSPKNVRRDGRTVRTNLIAIKQRRKEKYSDFVFTLHFPLGKSWGKEGKNVDPSSINTQQKNLTVAAFVWFESNPFLSFKSFFLFCTDRVCVSNVCECFLSAPRGGDAPKGGKKPVFFKTTFFHFFWVQDFKKKVKRNCLFLEVRKISRFIVKHY